MFSRLTRLERTLLLSFFFTVFALVVRLLYTGKYDYLFYPWNLFLAAVPYLFARKLNKDKKRFANGWLLAGWLLFFPNAPYLITDVFHFHETTDAPVWFDLILVVSGAWNGLIAGMVSLLYVERFLFHFIKENRVKWVCAGFIVLCSYGVYVGRYWRFNSWDIVTQPKALFHASAGSIVHPHYHVGIWVFTLVFGVMMYLIYTTMKLFANVGFGNEPA